MGEVHKRFGPVLFHGFEDVFDVFRSICGIKRFQATKNYLYNHYAGNQEM